MLGVRAVPGGAVAAGAALGLVAVLAWVALGAAAAAGVGWLVLGLAGYPPLAGLAASRLAAVASGGPLPARARPWLAGLAVAAWVPASGLYLALAVASARRAVALPATRRYELGWWAMVFPLGMYAAASHDLGHVSGSGALRAVATVAFWVALAAWLAVAAALARQGAWRRSATLVP